MAARALAVIPALLVATLVLGPVTAVLVQGGGLAGVRAADWAALRFTLWQAALSALLSVSLAIPVARALARRAFPGRSLLISVMGAPFILPVIVAILGLLAVFGGNGWLNSLLDPLGVPRLDIYGLHGILLAHVFFNLPLAVRMLLQGWLSIPAERFRVAANLGVPIWSVLEWPMLKRVCPGACAVIFVICTGSFAVALTLGGGPRATTVELAIYQAFRFDFDLARAATLALLQLGLGLAAGALAWWLSREDGFGAGLDRVVQRWDGHVWWDTLCIGLAASFLVLPLLAITLSGLPGLPGMPVAVWEAAGRSLLLALGATAITLALALPLASRSGEAISLLGISVSGLVLGTGLFLLLRPYFRPADMALAVTMVVNALMALPFVLRILRPELAAAKADFGRLSASLGLGTLDQWRHVFLPRLHRPLGFAAGLTAALAMGDLGVITLFADGDTATLPLQIYRLMGSYQMDAARGAALLLLALSLGLFWLFDRGGRLRADT